MFSISNDSIESENFVIHFTTSDVDSQLVNGQWFNLQCNANYAQSILDHLESALSLFLQDGWENIPPDCDESVTDLESPNHCINFGGNSLYDIYLSNDGVGMVVPGILKMSAPKNINAQKPVIPRVVTVVLARGVNSGNSLTVAREPQAKSEEAHNPIKKPNPS